MAIVTEGPVSHVIRERARRLESEAAAQFDARWTLEALRGVNVALYEAVRDQLALFREALVGESDADVILQGEAMIRGWRAASDAMRRAGVAEDGVLIGEFGDVVVAIGRHQAVPDHLIERHGDRLAYLRPREVAAMYMHYRQAQTVKAIWPDAEIVGVREKSDG